MPKGMATRQVVAGLPCGKEGPMIHSGAIVGAMVTFLGKGRKLALSEVTMLI